MNGNKFKPEGNLSENKEKGEYLSIVGLEKAHLLGKIIEARATLCDEQHNLVVDLGNVKGIINRDEVAIGINDGSVRDIAIITRVGRPICFKVKNLYKDDLGNNCAELSRLEAQIECIENYVNKLKVGDIIDAKVTHLENFGCFVDIGCGVISLITIDNISISRISHPRDRFYPGQNIKAVVKSIDEKTGRVFLSHKELLGTWEENANAFSPGQTAIGIVRSVESYGIFLELTPNLAGLAEFKEGVNAGQYASVYIKSIQPDKMKVKLLIVDNFDAPYEKPKNNYFITSGHLAYWRYSPYDCDKVVESVFA